MKMEVVGLGGYTNSNLVARTAGISVLEVRKTLASTG